MAYTQWLIRYIMFFLQNGYSNISWFNLNLKIKYIKSAAYKSNRFDFEFNRPAILETKNFYIPITTIRWQHHAFKWEKKIATTLKI